MFRQGRLRFLVPAALVLVAAVMMWRLMTEDETNATTTSNAPVYAHVCAAAVAEKAGDRDAAERRFVDDAHGPLHDLAAAAQVKDRAAAGRLLEAKQRVEAAVESDAVSLELAALVSTTRRAVEVADGRDPGPCS